MKKLIGLLGLTCVLWIAGCGGGGESSSGSPSVASNSSSGSVSVASNSYSGKTAPAALTASNSQMFFQFLFTGILNDPPTGGTTAVSKIAAVGRSAVLTSKAVSRTVAAAVPMQGTISGAVSGSATYSGLVEENGTGVITLSYRVFSSSEGYSYDGEMKIAINTFDTASEIITDAQLEFSELTITSPQGKFTMQGSMHQHVDISTWTETLDLNVEGRTNTSVEAFRLEDLRVIAVYSSPGTSLSSSETLTGRLYLGSEGYVDISQTTPLHFDYLGQLAVDLPNAGGPLLLTGAAASKARFTPLSISQLLIEVDSNGDDIYENTVTDLWSDLVGTTSVP